MFKEFKKEMQRHFREMSNENTLFYVPIDRENIYEAYLNGFTDPIERQGHTCNCCKSFLRNYGGIVIIDEDTLKMKSIWDFETSVELYKPVLENLRSYVHSLRIDNIFAAELSSGGVDSNYDLNKNITWNHFHLEFPLKSVHGNRIDSVRGERKTTASVLKRSLNEFTIDSLETVLELIAQGSLYRGEEFKINIVNFYEVLKEYKSNTKFFNKNNFIWLKSSKTSTSVTRIRNSAIGTLISNLSEDMDIDVAVSKYEEIVAPANYKRTVSIATPGMLKMAKEKLESLGLLQSLDRRFATESDIDINNVLFVDKVIKPLDVFDSLKKETKVDVSKFTRTEEISMEDFIEKVVPTSNTIEVLLENKHLDNLVSMITSKDPHAPSLFKWNNNFSWSYTGNIADSMKERVKKAGGKVDGVLRFSIQWNEDKQSIVDLDAHCLEKGYKASRSNRIYFGSHAHKKPPSPSSGHLDVDMINPKDVGVENIIWTDLSKMPDGIYEMIIHNYSGHKNFKGFSAEIEFDGKIYSYASDIPFTGYKSIAVVTLKDGVFSIDHNMYCSGEKNTLTKEKWNLKTNQFHSVNKLMLSPNYWEEASGNKHYFFMIKECKSEESPRPFYNEFLNNDLRENRKALEMVSSKLKVEETDNQLSGIGFSETIRNSVIVRVRGKFERILKVNL